MAVINLLVVNSGSVGGEVISKNRVPSTILPTNNNETIIKNKGKGTAAVYAGYNTGKPNLNAPWSGIMSLGVGTENDNFSTEPSLLLNPKSKQSVATTHNLVASCADIRLRTFGKKYVAKNRAIAVTNADIVQHRGNELIELVVNNSGYRANGTRIGSSGGVHMIKAGKENNLQPMVLGNNLTNTLTELTDFVNQLSTRIIELRKDLILMKTYLMVHVHLSNGPIPGTPTTPSPDLLATLGTSFVSDALEISNGVSNTINLELSKINHLFSFAAEKIISDDHKLT